MAPPAKKSHKSKRRPDPIIAGYALSVDDFKAVIFSLPDFQSTAMVQKDIRACQRWYRSALMTRGMPDCKSLRETPIDASMSYEERLATTYDRITSCFFPIRGVFPESPAVKSQETDRDRAALQRVVILVASQGGTFDPSKAAWKLVPPLSKENPWGHAFWDLEFAAPSKRKRTQAP